VCVRCSTPSSGGLGGFGGFGGLVGLNDLNSLNSLNDLNSPDRLGVPGISGVLLALALRASSGRLLRPAQLVIHSAWTILGVEESGEISAPFLTSDESAIAFI